MSDTSYISNISEEILDKKWMEVLDNDDIWNVIESEQNVTTHPVDTPEFLERLHTNHLIPEMRKEWLQHLVTCEYCSQTVSSLVKAGLLFTEEQENQNDTTVTRRNFANLLCQQRRNLLISVAMLSCVFLIAFLLHKPASDQAQREMLALMSQQGITWSTRITDNGYRMNGTSWIKAFPSIDPQWQKVAERAEKLLEQHPEDIELRIEYGKFQLFQMHNPQRAIQELETAKSFLLTPDGIKHTPKVLILQGLAAFEMNDDTAAQEYFLNVLDLEPENVDAKINLAVSLYRSGKHERAYQLLQELQSQNKLPNSLQSQMKVLWQNP